MTRFSKILVLVSVVFLMSFFHKTTKATTCTAIVALGNWSAPASWSCGRAPTHTDTIVVPVGKKITVDINSPVYVNMVLKVYGTLFFNNGQKLNFNCSSIVSVYPSGLLDGGNPGSKIDMCGTTVWRGPGPDAGPLTYGFNPLPINLLNFSVKDCDEKACIDWTTLTETNNDFFTIDKTRDDVNYEVVAKVKGAGNSTGLKSYRFTDTEPYDGVSYYRLMQTDYNGSFTIFGLREYNREAFADFSLNLYPNPGYRGTINVSVRAAKDKEILVIVYDMMGREAYSKVIVTQQNGATIMALDPSGKLEKGVYYVCASSDNKVENKLLVVN